MILICFICYPMLAACGQKGSVPVDDPATESSQEAEAGTETKEDETEVSANNEVKDSPKKTNKEIVPSGKNESKDRKELYQEVLYEYKEAQDGKYSMEQVEEMGLWTELVQHGWPNGGTGDEVRYLYYDVDDDGNDELIITYYNDIIDIWGYDGENAVHAFSTPYRGITALYPDGMLNMAFSFSAGDSSSTWYQYDTDIGNYFAVFEDAFTGGDTNEYYTFCYYDLDEESHKEVVDSYRESGNCPVWVYEWSDMISKEDYEKLIPTTAAIELPEGEPLSDVVLPDDYVSVLSSKQETEAEAAKKQEGMQEDLNLFLSNFAEQRMQYYKESLSDLYLDRIGYFAFMWSYINRQSDVKTDGNYYVVTYDTVRRLADRYFGLDISREDLADHETPDSMYGWFYKNGDFYYPAADGESYPSFAVVRSITKEDGDELQLQFDVYDLDMDIYWDNDEKIPSKYYSMSPDEAAASSDLTRTGTGFAIVENTDEGYKLKFYQLEE